MCNRCAYQVIIKRLRSRLGYLDNSRYTIVTSEPNSSPDLIAKFCGVISSQMYSPTFSILFMIVNVFFLLTFWFSSMIWWSYLLIDYQLLLIKILHSPLNFLSKICADAIDLLVKLKCEFALLSTKNCISDHMVHVSYDVIFSRNRLKY